MPRKIFVRKLRSLRITRQELLCPCTACGKICSNASAWQYVAICDILTQRGKKCLGVSLQGVRCLWTRTKKLHSNDSSPPLKRTGLNLAERHQGSTAVMYSLGCSSCMQLSAGDTAQNPQQGDADTGTAQQSRSSACEETHSQGTQLPRWNYMFAHDLVNHPVRDAVISRLSDAPEHAFCGSPTPKALLLDSQGQWCDGDVAWFSGRFVTRSLDVDGLSFPLV